MQLICRGKWLSPQARRAFINLLYCPHLPATFSPNSGAHRTSGGLFLALHDVIRLQVTLWTENDRRSTTSKDKITLVEELTSQWGLAVIIFLLFLLKNGSLVNYSGQRNAERSPENPLEVALSHCFRRSCSYFLLFTLQSDLRGRKNTQMLSFSPLGRCLSFKSSLETKESKLVRSLGSWHSAAEGQVKHGNLTNTDTGQRWKDLWLNCHSLPSLLFNRRCLARVQETQSEKGHP